MLLTCKIRIFTARPLEVRKVILELENIDREEFNDIMLNNLERFDVSDNKTAQSCSYIAVEVTDEV